jgi:Arc/MetJ-type ribon-helix-helix transcriptional regulator
MATQTINISLPKELIKKIDAAAKSDYASRSDYIRQALVGKLKTDRIESDDWDLLEALAAEIGDAASKAGYKTDQDFVRAVKEVRRDAVAKTAKK